MDRTCGLRVPHIWATDTAHVGYGYLRTMPDRHPLLFRLWHSRTLGGYAYVWAGDLLTNLLNFLTYPLASLVDHVSD